MTFVHLHNHTHYSLLDGLPKIKEFVAKAKECNMSSLAITDHGVMYGAIEFYQECKKQGIKPIIGVEAYLTRRTMADKTPGVDTKPYHIILLAKNNIGYQNLLKLTSIAHIQGFYYKPRIDWETLEKYKEGLIISTACVQGQIPQAILSGNIEEAEKLIQKYKDAFGEDFYLEIQHHPHDKDIVKVTEKVKELAKKFGIGLIATNDIHYLNPEDKTAQDILICIQSKKKINDKARMNMTDYDLSFRSPEKMMEDFKDVPEAITNTEKIAQMCNVDIELGKILLPHFDLPDGEGTPDEYLRKLCLKGLVERYGENYAEDKRTTERLEYELGIIEKTGFASYLLIVQDFISWAKNNGIVIGPGRGSAAGSLISYLIDITDVDPLRYNLLFERFLNPERISMPDIDIDIADIKRDMIIKYVENKYHSDHVAQIITFGTMASRAAIRDVGRVLDLPYSYCDKISKMIPMQTNLKEALLTVPEFKEIYNSEQEAKNLIDFAIKLEGVARHHSMHACGVIISKDPLDQTVPIQYTSSSDMTVISQYSLHPVEDLGLLKMDFLGIRNLTILENVIDIIEKIHGKKIILNKLDIKDKNTYKLLKKGQTTGVFQLESAGMKKNLKQLKPDKFEDIIAMVALYRPGPMQFIPDFIDRKHGRSEIVYDNPKLEPILQETYGIAVYQEQIMEIAKSLAGFTYGEADVLRKAVGKKIKELLDQQKEKLIDGMIKNGINPTIAKKIWDSIEPFASYGFNKSHATCYALIAFQTAYFKANYPTEFTAALLTSDQDDIEKVASKISDAKELGVEVLPPDINKSFSTFTVLADELKLGHKKIRFGLNAIKNLGENIVKAIIKERKENGEFENLEDFLSRVQDKDLNKKSLESLIKSGALCSFNDPNILLKNLDRLLDYTRYHKKNSETNQSDIFGHIQNDQKPKLKLDLYPQVDLKEKLFWEKEMLGLYISDHPFKAYKERLEGKTTPINDVIKIKKTQMVTIAGVIVSIQKILTKNNDAMAFVQLEDSTDVIELIVFPKIYEQFLDIIKKDAPIAVLGKMNFKDGQPKILVEALKPIEDFISNPKIESARPKSDGTYFQRKIQDNTTPIPASEPEIKNEIKAVAIQIGNQIGPTQIEALKDIFKQYPGESPVYFLITKNNVVNKMKINCFVNNCDELKQKIKAVLVGQEK